jgi:hypothetical protein
LLVWYTETRPETPHIAVLAVNLVRPFLGEDLIFQIDQEFGFAVHKDIDD